MLAGNAQERLPAAMLMTGQGGQHLQLRVPVMLAGNAQERLPAAMLMTGRGGSTCS